MPVNRDEAVPAPQLFAEVLQALVDTDRHPHAGTLTTDLVRD